LSKVAVVVSLYKNDTLRTLVPAIKSLCTQTKKVDIFVQEDGLVKPEVDSYLEELKTEGKIYYLGKREENLGIAPSYNELFEKVLQKDYEYIARMDSDDIAVQDRIEIQYNFMQKNKSIDVVGGYIQEFGDDFEYDKIVKYPLSHDEIFNFFSKRAPLANVTTFFRITYFQKAGLYPTTSPTNEDTLLWLNGFEKGCTFANINKTLVKVRVSKDFFTRRAGIKKAWSDLKDRALVIRTLRYNFTSYIYAVALFFVNIAPAYVKKFLYKVLR
jgi:GT2 family glycosyltransferase